MDVAEPSEHDEQLQSIDALVARAERLLSELTAFKTHAASKRYRQRKIPMRDFEGGIRSEIEHLQKIASRQSRNRDDDVRKTAATIRSSNLSSYELLWATAKRSRGVVAFRQWYRLEPSVVVRRNESKQTKRALVDIVAEDGEEWVKVSSVNEKRLLFDVAKEGWGRFGEDRSDFGSEGEEEDMGPHANGISRAHREDDVPDIPLLKSARDLAAAARANRVRGRIPKVRVVLPRVKRGESSEVDLLLAKLEASGCGLALADDIHEANPDLSAVLDRMSVDPEARLSTTLNIDCTILTSLISDISHVAHLKPEPWYNAMLREQLRFEREETLLPSTLYPVLRGRRLVTTERAAEQCRVIVDTIGNEGEKVRCDALLGRRPASEARDTLKKLSDHDVPAGVQVPIEVVRDSEVPEGTTPRSALSPSLVKQVCGGLSEINRSVFGFGWKTGWTTITSNNNTVRELETLLEKYRAKDGSEDEVAAPDTWICLPRSVVGKYDEVRQSRKEKRNLNKELQFPSSEVHAVD